LPSGKRPVRQVHDGGRGGIAKLAVSLRTFATAQRRCEALVELALVCAKSAYSCRPLKGEKERLAALIVLVCLAAERLDAAVTLRSESDTARIDLSPPLYQCRLRPSLRKVKQALFLVVAFRVAGR
jgi:hypothetical protein